MHSLNSMFVVTRFLEKDINYQDCKYVCLLIETSCPTMTKFWQCLLRLNNNVIGCSMSCHMVVSS